MQKNETPKGWKLTRVNTSSVIGCWLASTARLDGVDNMLFLCKWNSVLISSCPHQRHETIFAWIFLNNFMTFLENTTEMTYRAYKWKKLFNFFPSSSLVCKILVTIPLCWIKLPSTSRCVCVWITARDWMDFCSIRLFALVLCLVLHFRFFLNFFQQFFFSPRWDLQSTSY